MSALLQELVRCEDAVSGFPVRVAELRASLDPTPYRCGICPQKFATKGQRKRHRIECKRRIKAIADAEWAAFPGPPRTIEQHQAHVLTLRGRDHG